MPGPELAMGAIAEGEIEVLDARLIRDLQIPRAQVEQVAAREHLELDRRDRDYRAGRPLPPVATRTVMLVDDGLATGATMEAGVMAIRTRHAAAVIAAAPVGARSTCRFARRRQPPVRRARRGTSAAGAGAEQSSGSARKAGDRRVQSMIAIMR